MREQDCKQRSHRLDYSFKNIFVQLVLFLLVSLNLLLDSGDPEIWRKASAFGMAGEEEQESGEEGSEEGKEG